MSYGTAPPKSQTIPAARYRRHAPRSGSEHRPWSGAEAAERAEEVLDRLADAVAEELTTAIDAAKAEADYRLAKARALMVVGGSNADEREANVAIYLVEHTPDGELDPRQRRDVTAAVNRSWRERVKALQTEARIAQSLMVDSREAMR